METSFNERRRPFGELEAISWRVVVVVAAAANGGERDGDLWAMRRPAADNTSI